MSISLSFELRTSYPLDLDIKIIFYLNFLLAICRKRNTDTNAPDFEHVLSQLSSVCITKVICKESCK